MARRAPDLLSRAGRAAKVLLEAQLVPKPLQRAARALSSYGGHEAAKPARLRADWTTTNPGPNASAAAGAPNLVARSRDLERNNAHMARFLELDCDEISGTGVVPRATHPSSSDMDGEGEAKPRKRTRPMRQADAAWEWWARRGVADVEGRHTLYSLAWTMVRAWRRDGSSYARRVWDTTPGRLVPCRVQLLERDMLDSSRHARLDNGGKITGGIQTSPSGLVEGYWFFREHPGDSIFGGFGGGESVFVPERDVIALYTPYRAGQLDGIPAAAPIMARMRDVSQFQANEVARKATESCVVGVVTPPPIAEAMSSPEREEWAVTPVTLNSRGEVVGELRGGAMLTVENGGAVTFLQPHVVQNYAEYLKTETREMAVGLGNTYPDLSGDLEGVNYTSYRAGNLKRHAHVDVLQWNWFIPECMDRLWDWCQEGAFLTSAVSTPDMPREWSTPKRFSVDPEKDALADIIEERAGYALHDDNLAKRGVDPAKFYERRAGEKNETEKWGLVFDTEPWKQSFRGASANQTQGAPAESGEDEASSALAAAIVAANARSPGLIERALAALFGPPEQAPGPA